MNLNLVLFDNTDDFFSSIIEKINLLSQIEIKCNNTFKIVLTGGETAKELYSRMRKMKTDWSKWIFYFGDERISIKDDKILNSYMAEQMLLDHLPIKPGQVFKIPSYLGSELGALEYSKFVCFADPFDLVLLGLGEDGHIASLFPGNEWYSDKQAIPIFNSPKLPSERISLSMNRINNSKNIIIITKGESKQKIVEKLMKESSFPVNALQPYGELVCFYCRGC